MSFNDIKVSSKVLTRSIYFELFIFPIKFFGILNKVGEGGWDLCGGGWPASEDKEAAWREKVYIVLVYTYKGKGGGRNIMQFSSIAFSALNSAAYIHSTIIKQTRTTFYRDADGLRG